MLLARPANLLARISELAYEDHPTKQLLSLGFDLIRKYDQGETQAILITDDINVILAWRGTKGKRDLFTDLRYIKTDFPGGGRVHRGFYHAFEQIWDEVVVDLKQFAYPKIYTGHSLGAALAVEASVALPPSETHVYGCPRVGNHDFVDRIQSPLFRYETHFDPVTYVPLATSPVQALHALRHGRAPTLYTHGGKRVRIGGFGHYISRYINATEGRVRDGHGTGGS